MTKKLNHPVIGRDKRGRIQVEYPSIESVAKGGFKPGGVRRALTSGEQHCGLYWEAAPDAAIGLTGDKFDEGQKIVRTRQNLAKLLAGL